MNAVEIQNSSQLKAVHTENARCRAVERKKERSKNGLFKSWTSFNMSTIVKDIHLASGLSRKTMEAEK